MVHPFIYPASSDTKKLATAATSSGVPTRPIGITEAYFFSSKNLNIGVLITPGHIQLLLTSLPYFLANNCVNLIMPALETE